MFLRNVDRCPEVVGSKFLRNCDQFSASHELAFFRKLVVYKERETQQPRLPRELSLACLMVTSLICTSCKTKRLNFFGVVKYALRAANDSRAATLAYLRRTLGNLHFYVVLTVHWQREDYIAAMMMEDQEKCTNIDCLNQMFFVGADLYRAGYTRVEITLPCRGKKTVPINFKIWWT
jgi:hypothetical protein